MHPGCTHLWAALLLAAALIAATPPGDPNHQFLAFERLQQTTLATLNDIWGPLAAAEEPSGQGILLASELVCEAAEQSLKVFQDFLELIRENRDAIGPRPRRKKTLRRIMGLLIWTGQDDDKDSSSARLRERLFEYKGMAGKLLQRARDLTGFWGKEMLSACPEKYAPLQYACYALDLQFRFLSLLEELFGAPYYHHDPTALNLILVVIQASQGLLCLAAKVGTLAGSLWVTQSPRVTLDLAALPNCQADYAAAMTAIPEAINVYSRAISGFFEASRLDGPQCQAAIKALILDVDRVSNWLAAVPQEDQSPRPPSDESRLRALTRWSATLIKTVMPALEAVIAKRSSYHCMPPLR